jgi:hypothetical protein
MDAVDVQSLGILPCTLYLFFVLFKINIYRWDRTQDCFSDELYNLQSPKMHSEFCVICSKRMLKRTARARLVVQSVFVHPWSRLLLYGGQLLWRRLTIIYSFYSLMFITNDFVRWSNDWNISLNRPPSLSKTSQDSKNMIISAVSITFRVIILIRIYRNIKLAAIITTKYSLIILFRTSSDNTIFCVAILKYILKKRLQNDQSFSSFLTFSLLPLHFSLFPWIILALMFWLLFNDAFSN